MANKVTDADKLKFNELYLKLKTYAAVARETGFSASTVKKYIIPNFVSQEDIVEQKFDKIIPDTFLCSFPKNPAEWGQILEMTEFEKTAMEELRKEIVI